MKQFPLTKFQKIMEMFTWLLAAVSLIATAVCWGSMPKVMPIHYNTYGVADDWGGRWTAWILPVLLLICCGIVSVCVRLGLRHINLPFRVNMERELFVLRAVRDVLCVMNLECALLFAVLQAEMLVGKNLSLWFLWGTVGVIFATLVFGLWRAWKCNQGTL